MEWVEDIRAKRFGVILLMKHVTQSWGSEEPLGLGLKVYFFLSKKVHFSCQKGPLCWPKLKQLVFSEVLQ